MEIFYEKTVIWTTWWKSKVSWERNWKKASILFTEVRKNLSQPREVYDPLIKATLLNFPVFAGQRVGHQKRHKRPRVFNSAFGRHRHWLRPWRISRARRSASSSYKKIFVLSSACVYRVERQKRNQTPPDSGLFGFVFGVQLHCSCRLKACHLARGKTFKSSSIISISGCILT